MNYLFFAMIGAVSGLVFYYLAVHHVEVRSEHDNGEKLALLKKTYFIPVWVLSYMLIFLIVALKELDLVDTTEAFKIWFTVKILLFACLAFNIAAVDILLRRIPNAILLGMLVIQISNIVVIQLAGENAPNALVQSIVGMVLGYLIFRIPAGLKLSIGAGDIKYSAVIGFMVGVYDYIQAMLFMAVALLIFYVYLKITKTGNLKTKAPMGPFLSIGAFATMLFPSLLF